MNYLSKHNDLLVVKLLNSIYKFKKNNELAKYYNVLVNKTYMLCNKY